GFDSPRLHQLPELPKSQAKWLAAARRSAFRPRLLLWEQGSCVRPLPPVDPLGWALDRAPSSGRSSPDQPIGGKDDDRADHGADETCRFSLGVPADRLAKPGGEKSAGNAEDGRDDEAAGVLARHQQLCNDSGQQADDNGPNDPHGAALSAVQASKISSARG